MIRHGKSYKSLRVAMLIGIFTIGFFCGSLSQRRADAQLGELGGAAMKQAAGSGGSLGSVAEMGTSIMEMQEHVTGLKKNLDTFKKVQSALGGK